MIHSLCRTSLLVTVAILLADSALAETPATRKVRLNYTCEVAEVPENAKTIDLWIPIPSDNERQTVRLLNESELGDNTACCRTSFPS